MAQSTWDAVAKDCIASYKTVASLGTVKVGEAVEGIADLLNLNNSIHFSTAEPTAANGEDGDYWVVIE